MKKILSVLLSLTMLISITAGLNLTAFAKTHSGKCGDNLTWSVNTDTGVLSISGTGEMYNNDYYDYMESSYNVPWKSYSSYITILKIGSGVKSIGETAFISENLKKIVVADNNTVYDSRNNCNAIIKTSSNTMILGCKNTIIPKSVVSVNPCSFASCFSLTDVYYAGSKKSWNKIGGIDYFSNGFFTNDIKIHYNYSANSISIKSLAQNGTQIKLTWSKKSNVAGYEIQYATDKKFTKNKKTVTVKKASTTSKTIKGLKSKKTYYVRVRTYKTVNGKKIYSKWSTVKKVTTK